MVIFIIALFVIAIVAIRFILMWIIYDRDEDLLYSLLTNAILLIGASSLTLVYSSIFLVVCVIGQILVVIYLLYKVIKLKL